MIDRIKAQKAFQEYVKNYDPTDKKIALKIAHIERTSQVAKKIAESLNLKKEDIELAELIGLLHDIGRFEQIKRYHTFADKDSMNHGEFGVKILFEEEKIRDYISTSKYDEIIRKAILNHNRKEIEKGLTDKELLHAKIIRDADKVDILYIMTFEKLETLYNKDDISNEKMTDKIYEEFMEGKLVDYKKIQSAADKVIAHFAYVYDFNFKYSLKYIYENQYLEKHYKRIVFSDKETMKKYELIYETAKKYIEDKLREKED
jgi:putative nucleotidyltransferase with HDIG domain